MPNNSTIIGINEIEDWHKDTFHDESDQYESDNEALDDSQSEDIDGTPITYSKALESVNNVIKWCNDSEIFSSKHMDNLLRIRNDIVVSNLNKSKKQTNITDYMLRKD